MKKLILFKTLIDITFFVFALTWLTKFFFLLFSTGSYNSISSNFGLQFWLVFLFANFILLLLGLFYFKRTAKHLLSKTPFNHKVYENLNKGGTFLIISAIIKFCALPFQFVYVNKFDPFLQSYLAPDIVFPLLLLSIGLFFRIQGNALETATEFKTENDLTI